MKLKYLSTAMVLATLPATGAFAAALDRSGQSMSAFFQPGNYFEAGISVLDPTVDGKEAGKTPAPHDKIEDMADDYYFPTAALKLQFNDMFSFGLLYDQPFGAAATYSGDNIFVANSKSKAFSAIQEAGIRAQLEAAGIKQNTPAAIKNFADAKLGGDLALAQTMYDNNADLGGGLKLKDYLDAEVARKVKAGVQTNINNVDKAVQGATGGTHVDVDTENLSMIFGLSPIKNVTLYAGPVYQIVKGDVNLRGEAYSVYNGYDLHIKDTDGWGWLVGAAYQIPEIALKASLTYRSKIDHDVKNAGETGYGALASLSPVHAAAIANIDNSSGTTTITTPQSVNLDLQSGIMANTVAFANIRWVNWKDFSIQPFKFGQVSNLVKPGVGFNLVEYSDDQYSVTTGVGRKLNEKWAGNVSVGYDTGAGNPVSTLGPTEGYWNVGLGVQYSPTPATFIAGGVKYFWLGDAKAQTGAQSGTNEYVASFEDNNAIAYGLKLGYRF